MPRSTVDESGINIQNSTTHNISQIHPVEDPNIPTAPVQMMGVNQVEYVPVPVPVPVPVIPVIETPPEALVSGKHEPVAITCPACQRQDYTVIKKNVSKLQVNKCCVLWMFT